MPCQLCQRLPGLWKQVDVVVDELPSGRGLKDERRPQSCCRRRCCRSRTWGWNEGPLFFFRVFSSRILFYVSPVGPFCDMLLVFEFQRWRRSVLEPLWHGGPLDDRSVVELPSASRQLPPPRLRMQQPGCPRRGVGVVLPCQINGLSFIRNLKKGFLILTSKTSQYRKSKCDIE